MRERDIEDLKESCRTYLEQTKLLVALASAFLLAPAALWALVGSSSERALTLVQLILLLVTEGALIVSVFSGYVVFGSIAGSQRAGDYDVFRTATRIASGFQIGTMILAMITFALLLVAALKADVKPRPAPRVGPYPPRASASRPGPEARVGRQRVVVLTPLPVRDHRLEAVDDVTRAPSEPPSSSKAAGKPSSSALALPKAQPLGWSSKFLAG